MVRRLVAYEVAMWRNLYRWALRRHRDPGPGEHEFGYLGVVRPILGFFIGLSAVEIPVFDLIVVHVVPWRPARWIVLGLGVWGLLWMIGLYAGLKLHPHVVTRDALRVRVGHGVDLSVPWADVAAVTKRYRTLPSSKSVQFEDGALHLVVASQTSVDVRLHEAATLITGQEPANELRLYADDADGLVKAARDRLSDTARSSAAQRAEP
ncbi:hypothetical protein [Symbioplanes lichenis]|uniref:hypothetical protein n=1 Tax=Symbioplanes lichenis TaxID=1629072 RepID=UPI0027397145|nr:hypothetical protein [Actinoplanes lichenis]